MHMQLCITCTVPRAANEKTQQQEETDRAEPSVVDDPQRPGDVAKRRPVSGILGPALLHQRQHASCDCTVVHALICLLLVVVVVVGQCRSVERWTGLFDSLDDHFHKPTTLLAMSA